MFWSMFFCLFMMKVTEKQCVIYEWFSHILVVFSPYSGVEYKEK